MPQLARWRWMVRASKDILEKVHQKIDCATDQSQRQRDRDLIVSNWDIVGGVVYIVTHLKRLLRVFPDALRR